MSEYDDGNTMNQITKFVKKDPMNPDRTKFNIFDIIGTVTGGLAGGLILGSFLGFWGVLFGAVAGYLLTPHFVPKVIRWIKNRKNKNKY